MATSDRKLLPLIDFAYQGFGRGLDLQRIEQLQDWVQGERRPDLTILLDLPVNVGLERAATRSAPDRFERQQAAFFERVREGYLTLAARQPGRFMVIDAAQAIDQVATDVRRTIGDYLEGRH